MPLAVSAPARAFRPYRDVLAVPGVVVLELVGSLGRVPAFMAGIVCVLHVVQHLGLGYGPAGLVGAVATIGTAVSSPWRGWVVDRYGLRRALVPSIAAQAVCWSVAPFVPYAGLLVTAFVAGALGPPVFTVVRQSLAVVVPAERRRTAFSLDAVLVEFSYMVGPAAGTAVALAWSTTAAMLVVGATQCLAAVAMFVLDPPLRSQPHDEHPGRTAARHGVWTTALVLAMACAFSADLVLSATDLAVVAQLREEDAVRWTGLVLAVWAAGSVVGGLVHGVLPRPVPPWLLVICLGAATTPLVLLHGPLALAVGTFVAGLFCAPVISATVDLVAHGVHESVRGRAMGWHAAATTVGAALGSPLAGAISDRVGVGTPFLVVGLLGVVAGAATAVVAARTHVAPRS
ncbi:MFS transporter [Kineococcus rhizosphaerae]|uniref:Putative MFS family arabinose efflux permease n=1 Tax=Kineococcus rhizosphaerae TaxID=559628 RepID=A0A2T0R8T3_9ACTN|nr:MFS transporter [Kineococcus rhizosphaerae]PRY17577.1 putative MFS family arabinose efflux permease [Kineococcus rhizosphaerae]